MSPQGDRGALLSLLVLFGLAALGAVAYLLQLHQGDVVTGMRDVGAGGAVWGLYIVMDGFFLGSGIALLATACIARFSRHDGMEAAARIAMPSAIACFLGASLCVLADQGRPFAALTDLFLYGRAQVPMFATFTTVTGVCLFGGLIHWVLARRPDLADYAKRPSPWQGLQRLLAAGYRATPAQRYRRRRASFWMSLGMLAALLAPATALAILFVVRPGRTLDVVLLEVAGFLLLSFAGGIAVLVHVAWLVGRFAGRPAGLPVLAFVRLGRWLVVATSLSLLAVLAAEIASIGSAQATVAAYGRALLGSYASAFWGGVVALFLAILLLSRATRRRRGRTRTIVLASVFVEASVFLHHDWVLLAWQTHGLALPYPAGAYQPTWIEWAVVAGVVAVCILTLVAAAKLIPFASVASESQPVARPMRDLRRGVLTWLWLLAGLAAAAAGLLGSARVGTDAAADPALGGSPLLFIGGLMTLAAAGAVYELLPDRRAEQRRTHG